MKPIDEEYGFNLEDIEAYVLEKVASGEMDVRGTHQLKKRIEEAAKMGWTNREDWEAKPKADKEIGSLAYRYVLDDRGTVDDAIKHSLEQKGLDEQWWDQVKSRNTYKSHSKDIVKENQEHPMQQQMVKNDVFVVSEMSNIERIGTLLNRLQKCKNANDRITTLEQVTKLQYEELQRVKAESAANKLAIKNMENLNQLKHLPPKDMAREMWKQKIRQKDVAEYLEIHISTVKRWWLEFKKE